MPTVSYRKAHRRNSIMGTLLSGVTATGNGEWINVAGFQPLTVQVIGIITGTVEIDGSCEPSKPANTQHGFSLKILTADGAVEVLNPIEWVKARVTSYGSGTISCYCTGYQGTQGAL
jgi:hypothetical protein